MKVYLSSAIIDRFVSLHIVILCITTERIRAGCCGGINIAMITVNSSERVLSADSRGDIR
jgi:hypothetical protein